MATFYTLDRAGDPRAGMEIVLSKYDDINLPEMQRHADFLFPEGLSRHGNMYFLNSNAQLLITNPTIELIFEYVRRAYFPNRPSRFQSAFGCTTSAEVAQFRSKFAGGRGSIWKVSAERYFQADMSFLSLNNSILATSYLAHMYWTGKASPQPCFEVLLVPPVQIIHRIHEI